MIEFQIINALKALRDKRVNNEVFTDEDRDVLDNILVAAEMSTNLETGVIYLLVNHLLTDEEGKLPNELVEPPIASFLQQQKAEAYKEMKDIESKKGADNSKESKIIV